MDNTTAIVERTMHMLRTIDSERLKTELLDTQRWEDEGGQIIEGKDALPHLILIQPALPHARRQRRAISLQWNERFVIQPFRPGIGGMMLIGEKPAK